MKQDLFFAIALCAILSTLAFQPAAAQWNSVTVPPDGDNQRAISAQYIGLVKVTIDYNSPDVHTDDGTDRRGKIWGGLVPYGMTNLGFGTCGDQCPWRGGANQNTVFTVSHDVKVQGKPLKAGSYGLHFIPGQKEWTIIFSNNHTSWGSFTYDAREDALRVTTEPEESEYHEWLTYEFTERKPYRAVVALKWEDLQVPFTIEVENMEELYVENMSRELRSDVGFTWRSWSDAAQYCLRNKIHLDLGLQWAKNAISYPFIGQENFVTLSTLAQLQEANGQTVEAQKTLDRALNHPTATALDIHTYARSLLQQEKTLEAIKVFELNAKRHPNDWVVEIGLTRAYSASGNFLEALKHARTALKKVPDEVNRKNLENMIQTLEEGKDVN